MADTKKSEVVITCNAQQPKAAIRAMETELKRLQAAYKQLSDAGKAGTERAKQMAHEIKELSIAVKEGKANMDKIVTVTNNLSNSSLSQLQRALRQVKKEMGRVSTDSPKLDDLRQKYKAITDQIKILQGEMVNIQKHMGNLSQTSDAWLSRAINQQKQLVAQTDKTNSGYQRQVDILHQLQAEQQNRAMATVLNGGATADDLRAARASITSYRDQLGKGGIMPVGGDVAREIEACNVALKKCDEQLNVIAGKGKQIEPTVQEIEQDITKLVGSLANASPEQLRKGLEQCRNQLDKMAANDSNRQKWVAWAKQLKTALEGVDREAVDIDKVMRNLKKEPLENLRKAAKQLEEEMVKLNREDAKYKDRQKQLQKIRGEIDSVTRSINNQASAWSTTFRNISMYFGVFQLFSMAQQKLQEMLRSNLAYSDQLADIRKVTGLATKDVNELAESIAKLDTRTSIQELSDLAYQGGKMGFGKYGVEGMVEFVRAADQVKVALSDDLGEDSLLQISKLIDTMGLIPKLGVEKSMLSVGSAINQLAATSTASGTHIVDFSKRLTGLSRITGITTPELLALGSAADALGQAPEVAATAFGKLFTSLQTNHNLIEQQLNMEKGTINNLFSQGKAMEAILQIMEKMREKGNMNALGNIWKDLGSEGQRLIGVMATMSKNVDTVRAHVEEANEAFEEATSLTTEYAMKQETANAILERANQLWVRTFVNPEGVDTVKELSQAWYDMSQKLTSSALYMGQIRLVLTMIIAAYDTKWLEDQINQNQNTYGSVNWVSIYSDMVQSRFGRRTDGRSGFNNDYSVFTDMAGTEHNVAAYGKAIREYVDAWQEYNKTKKSIDAALDPLIGDYDPFAETPGELTNDAADKEAEKRRRAEEAARRKALRAEMREEQDKAKAIIDNVKNYYERQIAAITEMATRTGMDSELQKKLVDGMTVRMNSALANVRQAIAGTENEWADFRQSMMDDLYEPLSADGTNQSTQLLDNIIHNDIDQLKKMIETLSKELGQNGSVLLDQIWRKATENELANVKQANSAYQARQKVLLEKNYTGKVNRDYEGQMEQLGVAELTPSQSQQLMKWSQEGKSEDIQNFVDSRSKLWQQAFLKAREHIVDVFAADVSTKDGQKAMLTLLFGKDYNGTLSGSALESMLNMDLQQWQVFYQKLIEMSDAYTDAQKKAYDEAKRRADFVFNNRPDIQGIDKATQDLSTINSDQQRFGSDKNFTQQLGMSWNMDSDPEILRYRLLSEKARLYYQEMKSLREQDKISEQQLTDAKRQMMEAQTAMADKVAAKFNERVQLLQSFSEPMATFAEGVGEYLESLSDDAEDSNEKMKNMAKTMLKAYAKMTLQLMAEDLTRRVTKQLYHRQEEADETLHQQTLLQIQQMYQALMLTAQQTGDAARLTQHSTSNAAELSEEATATTGKVGLGIAGGAAKIIGTLGFWGIPLIAVITALLMGLLSWAISAAFGGSDSGGADSGPNVKLATGMLTYDGGNVQSVGGGSTPSSGTTSPVLGTDGKVYNAKQVGKLQTGIVTQPIATMVNGQPSLVGEKGPEMVIGRETTAAMQMARPDLINEIVKFDKNFSGRGFRTYDDGNLSDFTVPDASAAGDNMLTSEDIQGLRDTMAEFTAMMLLLQKNGLHVNKFGRGSVTQESADGAAFMRRNSGDRLWRKG